jgi:hypothetical protein
MIYRAPGDGGATRCAGLLIGRPAITLADAVTASLKKI